MLAVQQRRGHLTHLKKIKASPKKQVQAQPLFSMQSTEYNTANAYQYDLQPRVPLSIFQEIAANQPERKPAGHANSGAGSNQESNPASIMAQQLKAYQRDLSSQSGLQGSCSNPALGKLLMEQAWNDEETILQDQNVLDSNQGAAGFLAKDTQTRRRNRR